MRSPGFEPVTSVRRIRDSATASPDTKIDTADLDSPRRELSVRGLGFVVALLVCSGIDFRVRLQGGQSSCSENDFVSVT